MKNKRLIIIAVLSSLCLVATAIPASIAFSRTYSLSEPKTLSTDITPTKPGKGETVSFLPESLSKFWQMDDLVNTYVENAEEIGELTPYTNELLSWISYMGDTDFDKNMRRDIFEKYDLFRPTNNVLAWDSKINAKEYRIIISQDKTFANIEREYSVSGVENSVIFENPYTGVDYYWQVIATKNDDSLVYSDIFNFSTANLPRTLLIEGVSNTRDLGGNVGLNGKRMKQGLIYRGMGLEAISVEGENEFKNNLGIKAELDLRNVGEGTENVLGLTKYYHYPSPLEYAMNTGSVSGIEYTGSGSLVKNFGNAIKVLADKNNYPVYFHCAVGRDRTGWMGLCLNFLCGVSEEMALKEFCLSLFSTSGAYIKGNTAFYNRFINIRDYLNTFNGNNLSEKTEDYLVTIAGVTHEECESVRQILLGDIDTGFVPGKVSEESYANLAKVTFRRQGETPIIKMVEIGSTLDKPNMSGNGEWYHNNVLWDFDNDVVTEDMYLDYLSNDKFKVAIHYSGIDLPDDALDVSENYELDFSMFEKEGYKYRVYDDSYQQIESLVVTGDISINVVYTPTSGFIPKSNSRIIVMAGQSNGAGVAHYQYLSNSVDEAKIAEIEEGYDNVLITGYSHGNYMNGFKKVYANKHTATTETPGTFGFEVSLAERLSKTFPDETTYIVKYAYGGASLNYDWISPSSSDVDVTVNHIGDKERGWLYTGMVECLTDTIEVLSEATNTIPMIEAFMWMQGESDACFDPATDLFLTSFDALVDDFTTTFADNLSYKFAVYDAAINENGNWKNAKQINAIKKSRVDEHNVYIETNDRITTLFEPIGTGTDAAHYDAACYIDLGHMFADAYLSKTLPGYKFDSLEIDAPEKITMTLGEDYVIETPDVFFNGIKVSAKVSYFSQQYTGVSSSVYSYFKVNDDNSFTPTRLGETQLRITAYHHDEVRTVLVPVEVVA